MSYKYLSGYFIYQSQGLYVFMKSTVFSMNLSTMKTQISLKIILTVDEKNNYFPSVIINQNTQIELLLLLLRLLIITVLVNTVSLKMKFYLLVFIIYHFYSCECSLRNEKLAFNPVTMLVDQNIFSLSKGIILNHQDFPKNLHFYLSSFSENSNNLLIAMDLQQAFQSFLIHQLNLEYQMDNMFSLIPFFSQIQEDYCFLVLL